MVDDYYTPAFEAARQRRHHIPGIIGYRENSSPPFDLCFHAVLPQKAKQFFTKIAMKDLAQEGAVRPIHGEKWFQFFGVGEIAARLTADEQLLAWLIRLLEKQYGAPQLGRPAGGHHAAGPRTDNDYPLAVILIIAAHRLGAYHNGQPRASNSKKVVQYIGL
jgi:hypothetical protein